MPKSANEVFRDHVRFSGDGLPNQPVGHPLPVGDPRSGVHNPNKPDIRDWAGGVDAAAARAEAAAGHVDELMTLAEASSGALLLGKYGTLGFEVVPVVRRMETKFRKPAQGAVHSKASISSEQDAQFVTALTTKGRALVEVSVDLHDEQGAHALSATVEWFVAKR